MCARETCFVKIFNSFSLPPIEALVSAEYLFIAWKHCEHSNFHIFNISLYLVFLRFSILLSELPIGWIVGHRTLFKKLLAPVWLQPGFKQVSDVFTWFFYIARHISGPWLLDLPVFLARSVLSVNCWHITWCWCETCGFPVLLYIFALLKRGCLVYLSGTYKSGPDISFMKS